MSPLARILSPLPVIKIVDVGAMDMGEGTEAYAAIAREVACHVIGFEPQADQCAKLAARGKKEHTYLPYFIGDGSRRTFHECRFAPTSSLFEPNTELLSRFQNLANLVSVVRTSEVETKRLDDIPEVADADFLKLDVQGAELLVLQGAERTLDHVVVVQTEVEFLELYKGQPLFADIDAHLRRRGFAFHRFAHTMGRTLQPLVFKNDLNAALSQTLWGDAIYVRDFMAFDQLTPAQLLKLATILHVNYRSFDLAAAALGACDRQTGGQVFQDYVRALTG